MVIFVSQPPSPEGKQYHLLELLDSNEDIRHQQLRKSFLNRRKNRIWDRKYDQFLLTSLLSFP